MCATGSLYKKIALIAIKQLRRVEENCHLELFVDTIDDDTRPFGQLNVRVTKLDNTSYSFGDKIEAISATSFDKIVWLDVDVLCVRPFFHDILSALNHVSLIARFDTDFNVKWELDGYSPAICQANTGVVAIDRTSPSFQSFLDEWKRIYANFQAPHDQPAFRLAVLNSGISHGHLAPEFNALPFGVLHYPPRILHFTSDWGKRILTEHLHIATSLAKTLDTLLRQGEFDVVCYNNFRPVLMHTRKSNLWLNMDKAS